MKRLFLGITIVLSGCLQGCVKEEVTMVPAGELYTRIKVLREGIVTENCRFNLALVRATSKDPMNVAEVCTRYESESAKYVEQIKADLEKGNDNRVRKNFKKMMKISQNTLDILEQNMSISSKELKLMTK